MKIITLSGESNMEIMEAFEEWIENEGIRNVSINIIQLDTHKVGDMFEWVIGYETDLANRYSHLPIY